VRMRIRKPCVLARLRLFGWNVRFTTTAPNPVEAEGRQRQGAENAPKDDGTGLAQTPSTRLVLPATTAVEIRRRLQRHADLSRLAACAPASVTR